MAAGKAKALPPVVAGEAGLDRVEVLEFEEEVLDLEVVDEPSRHALFRAAFLAWLAEASGRFTLPVSVDAATASCTNLHIRGLHPAIEITALW